MTRLKDFLYVVIFATEQPLHWQGLLDCAIHTLSETEIDFNNYSDYVLRIIEIRSIIEAKTRIIQFRNKQISQKHMYLKV
jgi:hypothetical protein